MAPSCIAPIQTPISGQGENCYNNMGEQGIFPTQQAAGSHDPGMFVADLQDNP